MAWKHSELLSRVRHAPGAELDHGGVEMLSTKLEVEARLMELTTLPTAAMRRSMLGSEVAEVVDQILIPRLHRN